MRNRIIIFLAIAIAVAAIGLRLIGISGIQPTNSDEASYLRQSRFMATVMKIAVGVDMPIVDEMENGVWRYLRRNDWSEKPCWLHTGLVAVAMLIGGVSATSGVMVNILFSLGTVLVVFFLAKRIGGSLVAGVSSGLLAISGYWLIYSRSNWAEIDGVFFVVLAVYLLICAIERTEWRHFVLVFASAVFGGVAVLCHYRLLYIIGPLGLTALLVGGKRRWFTNGLLVVIGYFGVILGAASVIDVFAASMGGDIEFSGLLGAIGERFFPTQVSGHVAQTNFQPLNSFAFIFYLLRNQGWCAFVLMIIGLFALVKMREKRVAGISVIVFLLTPLLVLSMQKWVVARAAVIMVPFACIAVGVGSSVIWRFAEKWTGGVQRISLAILSFLLVGIVIENISIDIRLLKNRYGAGEVAEFLSSYPTDAVYVDPESKITYGWFRPGLPYRKLDLISESTETNIYVVFDAQKYHMYPGATKYVTELEQKCAAKAELVFNSPNMTTMWEEFLLDGTQANSLTEMFDSIETADVDDITSIRIYKMNDGK